LKISFRIKEKFLPEFPTNLKTTYYHLLRSLKEINMSKSLPKGFLDQMFRTKNLFKVPFKILLTNMTSSFKEESTITSKTSKMKLISMQSQCLNSDLTIENSSSKFRKQIHWKKLKEFSRLFKLTKIELIKLLSEYKGLRLLTFN